MSGVNVIEFCGIGIYAVFAVMVIRELRKEVSQNTSFAVFAVMLSVSLPLVGEFVLFAASLGDKISSDASAYISVILKSLGITYITYVSSEICKSAGEGGIAGQVELVGRIEILLLCIPYFEKLVNLALI